MMRSPHYEPKQQQQQHQPQTRITSSGGNQAPAILPYQALRTFATCNQQHPQSHRPIGPQAVSGSQPFNTRKERNLLSPSFYPAPSLPPSTQPNHTAQPTSQPQPEQPAQT